MPSRPQIFVLAGPNGTGKTTSANVVLPEWLQVDEFVNADLIARGLAPFAPERVAIEAGRLMLKRLHQLREQRATFAFETTLASRSFRPFLLDAKDLGYIVRILFIYLDSPDLAVKRVQTRFAQGGHSVPEIDIRRRYQRGLENFFSFYNSLADAWTICDNSTSELVIVATKDVGQESPVILDRERYETIRKAATHDKP